MFVSLVSKHRTLESVGAKHPRLRAATHGQRAPSSIEGCLLPTRDLESKDIHGSAVSIFSFWPDSWWHMWDTRTQPSGAWSDHEPAIQKAAQVPQRGSPMNLAQFRLDSAVKRFTAGGCSSGANQSGGSPTQAVTCCGTSLVRSSASFYNGIADVQSLANASRLDVLPSGQNNGLRPLSCLPGITHGIVSFTVKTVCISCL